MSKEKPPRKPYPSDLTDAQWTILEPLIPAAHTHSRGRPFWGRFFESGHDTHVFTLTHVPVAPAV